MNRKEFFDNEDDKIIDVDIDDFIFNTDFDEDDLVGVEYDIEAFLDVSRRLYR